MRVSTIIPAYNSANWIAQAIESVQAQTYPSDQIIVVDDDSSDDTAEVAEASGAEVLRMPKNGGSPAARNMGLSHASGDVIALLDADDYWAPIHLEILTSLFEAHPEASVACAWNHVQEQLLQTVQIDREALPGFSALSMSTAFCPSCI